MPADVAIVVTCHEPYLRLLPDALAAVDRQVPEPAERVLVLDGCAPPSFIDARWRFISGSWGHPSGARNAGLAASRAPWLVFLDADNVAPEGYLQAVEQATFAVPTDVAIIYPDIQYTDEALRPRKLWRMPAWDYWGMRQQNCADTSSAWRREALELVGGWPEGQFQEDYILALKITAVGWKAYRLDGPAILMREHGLGRRAMLRHTHGGLLNQIWKARSLAVVSLLAGRPSTLERWQRFLLTAELPPKTALYVVDNSGNAEFTRRVYSIGTTVASERNLTHFDVAVTGEPYKLDGHEPYMTKLRHLHVAQLYAEVLPRVSEDLVLTLEDDVEPPSDAVRRLGEELGYPSRANIGAVAAAYPSPVVPAQVCAGLGPDGWGHAVAWRALSAEPFDVACVGGGCTVWANWALRECVPHVQWDRKLGWDGVICMALRRRGYRIRLHGGVRCEHHRGPAGTRPDPTPVARLRPRSAPPRLTA